MHKELRASQILEKKHRYLHSYISINKHKLRQTREEKDTVNQNKKDKFNEHFQQF